MLRHRREIELFDIRGFTERRIRDNWQETWSWLWSSEVDRIVVSEMACDHRSFIFNGIDATIELSSSHLFALFHFQNKPLLKRQFKGHYCPESVIVETFFTNIANTITLLSRSWPGFEAISAKLGSISHEAFLRQYPMYKTSDADFNVLCHGDMWINNFLYKYNASRQPIDVQIVCACLIRFWLLN